MPLPHYTLQDWLVDWDWWTMHVIPEFLEAPSRSLLEKVEAYFKIRYQDYPQWRQGRIVEAWQFVLSNIQSLITEETASVCSNGMLRLHPDLSTVLWFSYSETDGSKDVPRVLFTPSALESYAQTIRKAVLPK